MSEENMLPHPLPPVTDGRADHGKSINQVSYKLNKKALNKVRRNNWNNMVKYPCLAVWNDEPCYEMFVTLQSLVL